MKVKVGDQVKVIAGQDKGKEGKVLTTLKKINKVVVEGINVHKKHQKPNMAYPQGGIITKEAPINLSNIMPVCPSCGKAVRVRHTKVEGKTVRVCVKCDEQF